MKDKKIESSVKWQQSSFSMEFSFDNGFEFEQVIPLSDLTETQREMILLRNPKRYTTIIESVHTIGSTFYEAYFYQDNFLIEKFDFK